MEEKRYLGFYDLHETVAKDGYLGAVLVVDIHGRPQEFRVTHPVKPSAFQRPLYGDALEPFIGVELCGKQLLRHLEHGIELLLVSKGYLLATRDYTTCPVVWVQGAEDTATFRVGGAGGSRWESEQLSLPSGKFQPVRITYDREDRADQMRILVKEVFTYVDLLEPFDRLARAVELLAKEDQRFA